MISVDTMNNSTFLSQHVINCICKIKVYLMNYFSKILVNLIFITGLHCYN
uniref:Uncharacterized protein n=1 Tax=Anguilla anguilla TaxID=7936 RepID=A0A0E9TBU2_ANGAN